MKQTYAVFFKFIAIAPRNGNIYLFKVLNNDCPVDMGRRARLGNKDCHFLSDAAQGKLNCRVHSQGKCVWEAWGNMLREDTEVVKGLLMCRCWSWVC